MGRAAILGAMLAMLAVITVIDTRYLIIPDWITLPGTVVGLMGAAVWPPPGLWSALMGLVISGAFFMLAALASRGRIGGGDIKLAGMIGAFLGWQGVSVAILVALLACALIEGGRAARGLSGPIAFGPFLAFGATTVVIWGGY